MSTPRVLILRAPGTNCDQETQFAFQQAGAQADLVHINRLQEQPRLTLEYQILCIPGGFSYGDDVAAGRIVAGRLRHHFLDALQKFQRDGKLILGICNGFQILLKSGLLLAEENGPQATLTWNDSGQFEDRWVHLHVDGEKCVFLSGLQQLHLPVAHAEGKFVTRDRQTLQQLSQQQRLVLRYGDPSGTWSSDVLPFPHNPNGSQANVAGICDSSGRVFGLMPHPERFIDATQHPHWTRSQQSGEGQGLAIFRNAVRYFS